VNLLDNAVDACIVNFQHITPCSFLWLCW